MRIRAWVASACAVALGASACASEEPIVLSEAPVATGTTDENGDTEGTEEEPGRFIARCATEADGDTVPGQTVFTDGSESVTDYCLSRFYSGVQPSPGLVYVPDRDTGYYAPAETTTTSPTQRWTPSQPRTDRDEDTTLRAEAGTPTETVGTTAPSAAPGEQENGAGPEQTTEETRTPDSPEGTDPGSTSPTSPVQSDPDPGAETGPTTPVGTEEEGSTPGGTTVGGTPPGGSEEAIPTSGAPAPSPGIPSTFPWFDLLPPPQGTTPAETNPTDVPVG